MARRSTTKSDAELLVLDCIAIQWGNLTWFRGTHWTWRRGEQWAVLGPNGSGKSLLALALHGKAAIVCGEVRYHLGTASEATRPDRAPEESIALLSPDIQRELATHESSFCQSRWHSGINEGQRTTAQFLSQASVEEVNPFAAARRRGGSRDFRERQREFMRWLGLGPLLRRKPICLSNGEQRKVLLAHVLLRSPRLLILDDPFGGLDAASRVRLRAVVYRLMRHGRPALLITSRPDEIPPRTTHLLLVDEPCQGLDASHRRLVLAEVDQLIERTGASLIFVTHQAKEIPHCVTQVLPLKPGRVKSMGPRRRQI